MTREIREGTIICGPPNENNIRCAGCHQLFGYKHLENCEWGDGEVCNTPLEFDLPGDPCTCGYQESEGPPCTASVHRVFSGEDKSMSEKERDDVHQVCVELGRSLSIIDLPTPKGSGTPIPEIVIRHIKQRSLAGTKKYGEPLKAHNGRDPLIDAYQEAHDLLVYLAQCLVEKYGEDFEI